MPRSRMLFLSNIQISGGKRNPIQSWFGQSHFIKHVRCEGGLGLGVNEFS